MKVRSRRLDQVLRFLAKEKLHLSAVLSCHPTVSVCTFLRSLQEWMGRQEDAGGVVRSRSEVPRSIVATIHHFFWIIVNVNVVLFCSSAHSSRLVPALTP
jgi:hypothetical protein